jgi:hypothetical protein
MAQHFHRPEGRQETAVGTDIEILYEREIKPRSRAEQERLVELIRQQGAPDDMDDPPPVDRQYNQPLLRSLLDRVTSTEGVHFDDNARRWMARRGRAAPTPNLTKPAVEVVWVDPTCMPRRWGRCGGVSTKDGRCATP